MSIIINNNIGLDIDGVLADFNMAWHKLYPEVNPRPDTWYCDDKILDRMKYMKETSVLDKFYLNIEPLINGNDLPFEPCCYITSRPVSSEITKEWLNLYGFPDKPVITVDVGKSKVKAAKENNVNVFVDDHYNNFVELNKEGIVTYLYTASWNLKHDVGHMRINTLNELLILK